MPTVLRLGVRLPGAVWLGRVRRVFLLWAVLGVLPGCVFFQLRDELERTQKGLAETNAELRLAGKAIGEANVGLSQKTVPAMAETTAAIRDTKLSLDGAAALREPMLSMNTELAAMRSEMAALKTQMEKTAALAPAMTRLADLREPMTRLASLEQAMTRVAELRDPMSGLQGLKDPMQQVAALREPLTTTGQLVPPMQDLSGQLRELRSLNPQSGLSFGLLLGIGLGFLAFSSLSTALGVYVALRLARRREA